MRRAIAVLCLVTLAGCGGEAPSSVVPADATIYVGVDAGEAERLVAATSRADVDFERDVRPWLGDRAAYFAVGPADVAGLVFETEDEDAAEAFGRKVTAAGPLRASAVIDGRLVIASTRDLLRAANAAADSGSLADSTRLDVTGEDGDDPPDILIATEEPRRLVPGLELMKLLPDLPSIPMESLRGDGPLTARVWNERGRRRVEVAGLRPHQDTPPSLADVTGAAWLAFASADLGEDAALARTHEQYRQIEEWANLDLERTVLPHLGAGMFFVRGTSPSDMGGRLVAAADDEEGLRAEAIALARRLGPRRADLHVERRGADERFLELAVDSPDFVSFSLRIRDGRVNLDVGVAPGGVAEDLDDTEAYRDAERQLGGPPTLLLVDEPSRYLAARDATEDGRRVLRVVQVAR